MFQKLFGNQIFPGKKRRASKNNNFQKKFSLKKIKKGKNVGPKQNLVKKGLRIKKKSTHFRHVPHNSGYHPGT